MASKVAIEVEIKNIKKIADLKKELKELRKAQRDQEKESKSGRFQSKESAKKRIFIGSFSYLKIIT